MVTNALRMPASPVVDARRNANPEWRQYLGATREAIRLLQALIGSAGGNNDLQARLDAISKRIEALPTLGDGGDKLVMWRGQNSSSGSSGATFEHGLGTNHIFWHIWNPANGQTFATGPTSTPDRSEGHIMLHDASSDPAPAGLEATFIGVISDRY